MSDWVRIVPSVRQQFNLLKRIWGRDVEPGFVFLPWIPKEYASNEAVRKKNFKNGPAFDWPPADNGKAILEHLSRHKDDDIYFTPARFNSPERRSGEVAAERALWADLDAVDPRLIKYQPTIAWESSPGRYQAVWLFSTSYAGASDPGDLNQRLTYLLEADVSGWDATQLLRVPGSKNHKPQFGVEGKQGYLLFEETTRPNWEDFKDLPEVPQSVIPVEDGFIEEKLKFLNSEDIKKRVIRKLPRYIRELLRAKDTGQHDRSSIAWQIARELADAGCEVEEIICVIRDSVWNKYEGRNDELKRLQVEAQKAIAERVNVNLETLNLTPKEWDEWQEFHEWQAKPVPPTQWLIRDFWVKGGLGFIAGIPKSYKSWFGLNFALAVSTGTEFLGVRAKRGRVLYIQEEDSESLVRDRLTGMMDQLCPEFSHLGWMEYEDGVVHWNPPSDQPWLQMRIQSSFIASDPDWLEKLEEFVTQHHISLVIFDTLMTVSGDTNVDSAQEIRSDILNPLKELARRLDLAVCFIHHYTKALNTPLKDLDQLTRASTRMMGSGQLHAWADCGLYVRDKINDRIYMEVENKQKGDRVVKIRIPQMPFHWKPEIVPSFTGEEHAEVKERVEPVKKVMGNGRIPKAFYDLKKLNIISSARAMPAPDLADRFGQTTSNYRKTLETGVRYGYVIRTDDNRYYADITVPA